ncbi:hypothetical protein BO99DRAFT_204939 [Aspergillus violaceofuscus CBS 115571]|uniref:Uncharacterized protein n=1 Tax=Aspergillus violaceofuscus (strain CBS 115571) TaxID=1450538 RepID=A0A2V5H0Q4_ASPV1|nr:hypothetical protein BO99DRAFT_204939 [Aspergillus violaceofuscus CBS 115571]
MQKCGCGCGCGVGWRRCGLISIYLCDAGRMCVLCCAVLCCAGARCCRCPVLSGAWGFLAMARWSINLSLRPEPGSRPGPIVLVAAFGLRV